MNAARVRANAVVSYLSFNCKNLVKKVLLAGQLSLRNGYDLIVFIVGDRMGRRSLPKDNPESQPAGMGVSSYNLPSHRQQWGYRQNKTRGAKISRRGVAKILRKRLAPVCPFVSLRDRHPRCLV